jgi:hypothetical protein
VVVFKEISDFWPNIVENTTGSVGSLESLLVKYH